MSNKEIWSILFCLLALILALPACAGPTATTGATTTSETATPTTIVRVDPEGTLVAALSDFGNENFLPWQTSIGSSQICDLVYDMLIYWDEVNRKFIPGIAESWEVSPDALTATYHLRKGIQFSDGWGELTSADVMFNFEMQASPKSMGKTAESRNIESMDTPDPYTLVVHLKKTAPAFIGAFSLGNGGNYQGIASKKYVETIGEETASQKPIGSGPFKLVESQLGSYYTLEAFDNHWRVVPEFKSLTLRLIPEVSSVVAALKNNEVDLASVPSEQLAGLKNAGLATEITPTGVYFTTWGGLAVPEDPRYDPAYHNKSPWTDVRVRKALCLAIDRQAICNTIFAGAATPAGHLLFSAGMNKYQYPYDPGTARQLLKDAGYPDGFSFEVISYVMPGVPEMPRVQEALAGYWQQIGLNPKITVIDYNAYQKQRVQMKTTGNIAASKCGPAVDMWDKVNLWLPPNCVSPAFQDEASLKIWKEGTTKLNADERAAYIDKLNQYFFENIGPMPIVNLSQAFAWNSGKIGAWPHSPITVPYYLEYVRHAQPLNTFRLFTPWPGR